MGEQSLKYSESDDSEEELEEFGSGNDCEVVVVVGICEGVDVVVGVWVVVVGGVVGVTTGVPIRKGPPVSNLVGGDVVVSEAGSFPVIMFLDTSSSLLWPSSMPSAK